MVSYTKDTYPKEKLDFVRRRNLVGDLVLSLRSKININEHHLESIEEEEKSVVEYVLDKEDVKRLNEEIKVFYEMIEIVEKLSIFMESWYLTVKK